MDAAHREGHLLKHATLRFLSAFEANAEADITDESLLLLLLSRSSRGRWLLRLRWGGGEDVVEDLGRGDRGGGRGGVGRGGGGRRPGEGASGLRGGRRRGWRGRGGCARAGGEHAVMEIAWVAVVIAREDGRAHHEGLPGEVRVASPGSVHIGRADLRAISWMGMGMGLDPPTDMGGIRPMATAVRGVRRRGS